MSADSYVDSHAAEQFLGRHCNAFTSATSESVLIAGTASVFFRYSAGPLPT
jgi:hypothetical protein